MNGNSDIKRKIADIESKMKMMRSEYFEVKSSNERGEQDNR
jgi:hypothetical protein